MKKESESANSTEKYQPAPKIPSKNEKCRLRIDTEKFFFHPRKISTFKKHNFEKKFRKKFAQKNSIVVGIVRVILILKVDRPLPVDGIARRVIVWVAHLFLFESVGGNPRLAQDFLNLFVLKG